MTNTEMALAILGCFAIYLGMIFLYGSKDDD